MGENPSYKMNHPQADIIAVGGTFRCPPLRVRSPYYTAAVNLAVMVAIPPDSAVPMAPVAPVPNAAATAPMIQAATIMYSNDTTPSWSLAKVFTLFRNLRMLNASKLMLSFKIQF